MTFNASSQIQLKARGDIASRWLLWTSVRNRTTNQRVDVGLWTGDDDISIPVDGTNRIYQGLQGGLVVGDVVTSIGTMVRKQKITLTGLTPEAVVLVRAHDARLAPVELHVAIFDPVTMNLIGIDQRFVGNIDKAPMPTPALGEGGTTVSFDMVSKMRGLTRHLPLKKSHSTQSARSGDMFRQYGSIAAVVNTKWGEA